MGTIDITQAPDFSSALSHSSELTYSPKNKTNIYDPDTSVSTKEQNTDFGSVTISWRESEKTQALSSNTTVFDVAAYILEKMGELSTMKLHKLIYYCQAWSLVWDEMPLFSEPIEAWANGPVVRGLFNYHKGHFLISRIEIGNSSCLTDNQKDTIDKVLEFYGDKSSQWLIDLTHMEDPWREARKGLSISERGARVIELDAIAGYYSSL